jgi:hypothetical protein
MPITTITTITTPMPPAPITTPATPMPTTTPANPVPQQGPVAQPAPLQQLPPACPDRCSNYENIGNSGTCKLYVSSSGWCGDDVFIDTTTGKNYGWGVGYVAQNRATITDCTRC